MTVSFRSILFQLNKILIRILSLRGVPPQGANEAIFIINIELY
jgi:hypothetical protein